jgi:hypothetical protein
VATLTVGEIRFRAFLPPGIRIPNPFAQPVVIPVTAVDQSERSPGLVESWSVNPNATVVRVDTGSATIEWALVAKQAAWALDKVR